MSALINHTIRRGDTTVAQLIEEVRRGSIESLGEILQAHQVELTILATSLLDRRLRRRLSPQDLVQETMLAAHRDFPGFRGHGERELVAWLRQILSRCLTHAIERHVHAKKRDVRREVNLDRQAQGIDRRINHWTDIIADRSSAPIDELGRREVKAKLLEQLSKLKPEYRTVITYRNLQGLSFQEIADRMDRKSGTVRMLWKRAMKKFKETCDPIG
ncbi:MAG: sigma-70 family RNA polymerase sigma factor [Planctomycetota bacterium]